MPKPVHMTVCIAGEFTLDWGEYKNFTVYSLLGVYSDRGETLAFFVTNTKRRSADHKPRSSVLLNNYVKYCVGGDNAERFTEALGTATYDYATAQQSEFLYVEKSEMYRSGDDDNMNDLYGCNPKGWSVEIVRDHPTLIKKLSAYARAVMNRDDDLNFLLNKQQVVEGAHTIVAKPRQHTERSCGAARDRTPLRQSFMALFPRYQLHRGADCDGRHWSELRQRARQASTSVGLQLTVPETKKTI